MTSSRSTSLWLKVMCSPVTSLPQFKRGHFRIGQRGHYCLGLTPRDHGALDGNQKDIGPPRALRHGGCCSSRELKHRAGGMPTALGSVLWQRHHRGSWAPAFAGETKRGMNPSIVPAECPLRWGPLRGSGTTAASRPLLSWGRRKRAPAE